MKSLAIIGTGIAGMACAYSLHRDFALTVYEKNNYAGGHTNTVFVPEEGRHVPVDTGFMVYNEVTYPKLTALFKELNVPTKPAPMSFSVQHLPTGLEFCGSGLNGLFAQRRNLARPRFWKLLLEISRFNREAPQILTSWREENLTLGDYIRDHHHSADLLNHYLIPMSSAVWSTPSTEMLSFPVMTLVRFFKNHGFLGLSTQHAWRTVDGGSAVYRDKIMAPWKQRLLVNRPATLVTRREGQAFVYEANGTETAFDHVIIATHADEALALLGDPTAEEMRWLKPFRYQKNIATLHSDEAVMPRTRSAWSSWNYRVERDGGNQTSASTIYWMNSLQNVSDRKSYFVSINDPHRVDPSKVHRTITYDHPLFNLDAIAAQAHLPKLNANGVTFFCGSYFRYGFHEDALMSGLAVVDAFKGLGHG